MFQLFRYQAQVQFVKHQHYRYLEVSLLDIKLTYTYWYRSKITSKYHCIRLNVGYILWYGGYAVINIDLNIACTAIMKQVIIYRKHARSNRCSSSCGSIPVLYPLNTFRTV